MIKFNELRIGDLVVVDYEGNRWEGEVIDLNGDEKQVCVQTEAQDFWYETKDLYPIPLDEAQLFKLGFQKLPMENGEVKYVKGAFRVMLHKPDDFSVIDIWYREDKRHFYQQLYVHEFQNHYYMMTKVPLAIE
jgi:hypothetical protein